MGKTKDHPRVCGEKKFSAQPLVCVLGSPPRMRGKAMIGSMLSVLSRITPAYAGKRLN